MLDKVINLVNNSSHKVDDAILICNHKVENIELLKEFYENELIEDINFEELEKGVFYELELSVYKLQKIGFYIDFDQFVINNKYKITDEGAYILDRNITLTNSDLCKKSKTIIELINELRLNSKHYYTDVDIDKIFLVREDKSLFLKLDYKSKIVELLDDLKVRQIYNFIEIIKDDNLKDKKNIFLNELIEFCSKFDEEIRFSSLVINFDSFINNALSTYNFYLRNFSYNKLKLEIDSKAIEFNQKLQAVINDSQTKLIAIPTAFVIVLSSLDYDNITSVKNIIATGGLYIFSILLQIFVSNQKSVIRFIEENIEYYKSTFKNQDRKEVESSFSKVNSEKSKQYERLILIEILLWLVPVFTTSMLFFLSDYQFVSIIILFFFMWIASNKLLLKY